MVWDVIVLGAGCTGLTLANELLAQGLDRFRLLLLESRQTYENDRTWCFWNTHAHRFEPAVSRRWSSWSVKHHGQVLRCSGSYDYQYLRAADFYQAALSTLPSTQLELGQHVEYLVEHEDQVAVHTKNGTVFGRKVIDTRPSASQPVHSLGDHVHWLQHFAGWHVRTSSPCFDPNCVQLMDFDAGLASVHPSSSQNCDPARAIPEGIPFFYVLPFSETEALVESTWFGPQVWEPGRYKAQLNHYLCAELGTDYELLSQEHGVLPMSTLPAQLEPSRRIWRLGLAGGAARPSTGYAFLAIQRHAQHLARQLVRGDWRCPPAYYSSESYWLDKTFLRVLREDPQRGPELFFRLFQRVEPDALVRFLSDQASLRDIWQVISRLPAKLFLRQSGLFPL